MTDRIVVHVAYPGIAMLDLAGPAEVFATANRMAESGPRYRSLVASADGRPIACNSGLRLDADTRLSSVTGRVDTLLISAGLTYVEAMRSDELVAQVRRIAGMARRVGSTCVGAFVLAAAGLLDGRTATSHWAFCEELSRDFPNIKVEPDRIFVRDGNVFTSAGVTAGWTLRWLWSKPTTASKWPARSRGGWSCSCSGLAASHSSPSDSPTRSRPTPRCARCATRSSRTQALTTACPGWLSARR
jgi:transcriptional regulator GlxA family with amidase domain